MSSSTNTNTQEDRGVGKGGRTPRSRGPPPLLPLDLPILDFLKKKRVVLASASPRRRALLAQIGLGNLEVVPSSFPEDVSKASITPHEYVALTAQEKCLAVYKSLLEQGEKVRNKASAEENDLDKEEDEDRQEEEEEKEEGDRMFKKEAKKTKTSFRDSRDPDLVIAADTIIATRGGQVLEKPQNESDHRRMLKHLRDTRSHSVLTAVCCLAPKTDATFPGYVMDVHTEETIVYFARETDGLPDSVIDSYVRTREGCDKAGGYAVQGVGGLILVERIEGGFDNIVGLPVRRCLQLAEKVVFRQDEEEGEGDEDDDD